MVRFTTAEIEFVADNPGPTLFHCHHQDHQDEGFIAGASPIASSTTASAVPKSI